MANEIKYLHDDAAETVYCIARNMLDQWYYGGPLDKEVFEATHWGNYDIALSQVDVTSPPTSGNVALQGTFDPGIGAWGEAGYYWLDFYVQAGANPAQTDHRLASRLVYWDGTAFTPAAAADGAGIIDSTGGTVTMAKAVEALLAFAGGKCSYDAATGIATYYGRDCVTVILTTPLLGGGNRDDSTIY